jgi:two-component system clock-associated histidine kinase SasA
MQVVPNQPTNTKVTVKLLLFVDSRPHSREQIQDIRTYLKQWRAECPCHLEVINVVDAPYLAEHYKLIATPTLIKIYPEPRQVLTGHNIVTQLEKWRTRWQSLLQEQLNNSKESFNLEDSKLNDSNSMIQANEAKLNPVSYASVANSAEIMRLSDEVFRLKQEKEELAEQLRFKDQVIAMLAHDIRNPLTAISIALETLTKTQTSSEGKETAIAPNLFKRLINHARNQAKAMDRLIEDILQGSRGDQDQFHLHHQSLNLNPLCQDIFNDFSHRLEDKSLELVTDIPNDLPCVYADPDRVRQVIVNLLDNACKYSPEGGTITVSILHRTTQKVQVSISDNGQGIPPENQAHIFEDHFRLKRDRTQAGYGIGLSVCQQLIRAHYGQIWVDSHPPKGSTFHFTLPVYQH